MLPLHDMQRFWNYVSLLGTRPTQAVVLNRHIILCNRLSIVVSTLTLLLFLLEVTYFGFGTIPVIELACFALTAIPLFLNAKGFIHLSRIIFCALLPTLPIAISVYAKMIYPGDIGESFYYDYRYILLGTSIIPPLLFSSSEKAKLFLFIALHLACFLLFDTVHEAFNVGYFQLKHSSYSYPFSGSLAIVIFFVITTCALVLKNLYEGFESQNTQLIEELTHQKNKLHQSQLEILDANIIIRQQKEQLLIQNRDLESELLEKNKNLIDSNNELMKHNNELRQFSYTVSHNLRSPVASLMGLLQLMDKNKLEGENATILNHSIRSVNKLDSTIRDLGKIIDIRNDIFRIRQQINLQDEIDQLKRSFEKEIVVNQVSIVSDFSALHVLYSVRPMVASILYNLVSNSIKYRSPLRAPQIEITSSQEEKYFILTVKDNGLGIDTQHHKDSLFMMYKRFHPQTEGKGLGLYLVKLQAEALGGYVEITSEVNRFTQFIVRLKKPDNVERQVLYDESHAQIFFDAPLNSLGVIWRGPLTQQQYTLTFNKCLDFIKVYNTPNYISDLTHQGEIQLEDQQWVFNEIFPSATVNGLKRIAIVKPSGHTVSDKYVEGIGITLQKLNMDLASFTTMEEAYKWIQQQNDKTLTNKPEWNH